ncbi:MAG: phosphatidate cytidylyltransferase, partial [Methanothermobacter sp.]
FGFNISVASASVIILTLGDSLSTIIGREYGSHPLPFNPDKSIEGSAAFLLAGFLGALFFLDPITALTGAIAGMLVEAYTPVEDNITIPIGAGAMMLLLVH